MPGGRSPFFPVDRPGGEVSSARVTRLYFDTTEDLGDPRGYKLISIQKGETFREIKIRYAMKYCAASLGSRGAQDGSMTYFKLKLMFRSISRLSRAHMIPHEGDSVLRVLQNEEKQWPGFIYLVKQIIFSKSVLKTTSYDPLLQLLTDIRRGRFAISGSRSR